MSVLELELSDLLGLTYCNPFHKLTEQLIYVSQVVEWKFRENFDNESQSFWNFSLNL